MIWWKMRTLYDQLHAVQGRLPKGAVVIMMGHLNAKVGSDNTMFGHVVGKYGIGDRNDNGLRIFIASTASSMVAHCSTTEPAIWSIGFQLIDAMRANRLTTLRSAVQA